MSGCIESCTDLKIQTASLKMQGETLVNMEKSITKMTVSIDESTKATNESLRQLIKIQAEHKSFIDDKNKLYAQSREHYTNNNNRIKDIADINQKIPMFSLTSKMVFWVTGIVLASVIAGGLSLVIIGK